MRRLFAFLCVCLLGLPAPAVMLSEPIGTLTIRRIEAPSIPLGLSAWDCPADPAHAVSFVIVAEAYTLDRLYQFPLDALRLRNTIMGRQPWKAHAADINWYLYVVPSNRNGAGTNGIPNDTAWRTYYGERGVARLIGYPYDTAYDLWSELSEIRQFNALILVNDARYGGAGGNPFTVSTHTESGKIGAHELGHSFAHLGDEYSVASGALPFQYPNVALSTNALPWAATFGEVWFRIAKDERFKRFTTCAMSSLTTDYYCDVCKAIINDEIEKRIK